MVSWTGTCLPARREDVCKTETIGEHSHVGLLSFLRIRETHDRSLGTGRARQRSLSDSRACLLQISTSARPGMEVVIISAKTPWAVSTAAAEKDLNC